MTIENRPIPRFIADASQHGIPHGRFAERLSGVFRDACAEIDDLPEGTDPPEEITWFPERAWSGRVWVPASGTGRAVMPGEDGQEGDDPVEIEFFGFVSFVQPVGGDPRDESRSWCRARHPYTGGPGSRYPPGGRRTTEYRLSLIHISEPTRPAPLSRMPSSA